MSLDRRIGARLAAYGWTDALDDVFAAELGCDLEDVVAVRRQHELRLEALELARLVDGEAVQRRVARLAGLLEWDGSRPALLVRMLDGAIARVERRRARGAADVA